jgi:histidine triad (HIT) family protein
MDCLFCKIAEKKIPARIIHEDDLAVAFEDVNPQAPVHFLVIPKKHIAVLTDMTAEDDALMGHLYRLAARLAAQKGVAQSGFRTLVNCNRDAGQSVFHIHLHVLGGRPMAWPPG